MEDTSLPLVRISVWNHGSEPVEIAELQLFPNLVGLLPVARPPPPSLGTVATKNLVSSSKTFRRKSG